MDISERKNSKYVRMIFVPVLKTFSKQQIFRNKYLKSISGLVLLVKWYTSRYYEYLQADFSLESNTCFSPVPNWAHHFPPQRDLSPCLLNLILPSFAISFSNPLFNSSLSAYTHTHTYTCWCHIVRTTDKHDPNRVQLFRVVRKHNCSVHF